MAEQGSSAAAPPCELKIRPAGSTEHSWCKAVPGGTGITVLALLLSKSPDISLLQNALHKLQNSNPILKSQLHYESTINSYSYIIPSTSHLQIQPFDLSSTDQILRRIKTPNLTSVSDFHLILEHEINHNSWSSGSSSSGTDHKLQILNSPLNTATSPDFDTDVFFASIYRLNDEKSVVTLRIHTSVCDRAAALALMRKLLELMSEEDGEGTELELGENMEVGLGIKEYIWARGIDMVGYGLNSFRFSFSFFLYLNFLA